MATAKETKERCVAGAVKHRRNRDGSITFTVAGKDGKKFTLAESSKNASILLSCHRALVRYLDGTRNPKILVVLSEPSSLLIRQHNMEC